MFHFYLSIFLLFILAVAVWKYGGPAPISRSVKIPGVKITHKNIPVLSQFSKDLTALAAEDRLDPVIGRDKEIKRVIQILSRRTKNNPVLVGKSGIGKTAIVEGLAQHIVKGQVPDVLKNKKVLALDLASLVAGTKYRGEFEQRMKRMTDEIINAQRTIILFIDEIHSLAEAGEATGAIDADDILKPPLARGDLQVVGTTTPEEYEKFIKSDTTLDRRLQPILVNEPSAKQTLEILKGIRPLYEEHHGVEITNAALEAAVSLAGRYLPRKAYPDKAIDLMDEAASKVKLESINDKKAVNRPKVNPKDVAVVARESAQARLTNKKI